MEVICSPIPIGSSLSKHSIFLIVIWSIKSWLCFGFCLLFQLSCPFGLDWNYSFTSRLPRTMATLYLHHSSQSIHHLLSRGLVLIGLNWGGWQCLPHVYGMPSVTRCGRTVRVSNTGQWRCHVGELISGNAALRLSAPDPTTLGPLQGRQVQARTEALWDCSRVSRVF